MTPSPPHRLRALILGMLERIDDNPAFFRLALATQGDGSQGGAAVGTELALIGLDMPAHPGSVVEGIASGDFRRPRPRQGRHPRRPADLRRHVGPGR